MGIGPYSKVDAEGFSVVHGTSWDSLLASPESIYVVPDYKTSVNFKYWHSLQLPAALSATMWKYLSNYSGQEVKPAGKPKQAADSF